MKTRFQQMIDDIFYQNIGRNDRTAHIILFIIFTYLVFTSGPGDPGDWNHGW